MISIELGDHNAVLSLDGRLDARTIPSVFQCVACLDGAVRTVTLDLGELAGIDADAIHSLVGLRQELEVRLQHLESRNLTGETEHLLAMAGVTSSFEVE